jgi:hypothetical protein
MGMREQNRSQRREGPMRNEPEATDQEHEAGPGRRREDDAMRGGGHDDPESVGKADEDAEEEDA